VDDIAELFGGEIEESSSGYVSFVYLKIWRYGRAVLVKVNAAEAELAEGSFSLELCLERLGLA
jgi:hypothetical protein